MKPRNPISKRDARAGTPTGSGPCSCDAGCFGAGRGRLTTGELGRRLRRDPSMVSRLAAMYAAQRDATLEA